MRVAGVGHPMSFFLPMKIDGQDCRVENDRFGWRFFGSGKARALRFHLSLRGSNRRRRFGFLSSANQRAYGVFAAEFGLCRLLQCSCWKDAFRINTLKWSIPPTTGIIPTSSFRLPGIAPKMATSGLIYMGNNETVGPYGSGTSFGVTAASLPCLDQRWRSNRRGSAGRDLIRDVQKRPVEENDWQEVAMFLDHHVRAGRTLEWRRSMPTLKGI